MKRNSSILLIFGIALAIILLGVMISRSSAPKDTVAVVNGEQITENDLEELLFSIQPDLRPNVTRSQVIDQAINYALINQEAEKQGIKVSDAEIDSAISAMLKDANVTQQEFESILAQDGRGVSFIRSIYKRQLTSIKFVNITIMPRINVTEDEISTFYSSTGLNVSQQQAAEIVQFQKAQQELLLFLQQKRNASQIQIY